MSDNLDNRILGAVCLVDAASGLPAAGLLLSSGPGSAGVRLVQNRRGIFVVVEAPGFSAYAAAFQAAPAAPAPLSVPVELRVSDPSGRYLPRRCTVKLPRDPDPAQADPALSLFEPATVTVFASPTAQPGAGWAVVRVSVAEATSKKGLAGVLLRVVRTSDGQVLARGLSDARGEALVGVPGIPVTTWGTSTTDSVLTTDIEVSLEAIFDPAGGDPPDPDAIEAKRASLPQATRTLRLASGAEAPPVTLQIPVP